MLEFNHLIISYQYSMFSAATELNKIDYKTFLIFYGVYIIMGFEKS